VSVHVSWQILSGKSSIGVAYAAELLRVRLAYMQQHGSDCNQTRLIDEALQYATMLRDWTRANQPVVTRHVERDTFGKPGPMSDG